jgi:hypothetical protein
VRVGEAAARYDARQLTEYSHRGGIIFRFNTTVGPWRGSDEHSYTLPSLSRGHPDDCTVVIAYHITLPRRKLSPLIGS